jgi:hypothetical protein
MAHIRLYHPLEPINAQLTKAGFTNGQPIHEKEVMKVVGQIYRKSILNIMIQHHGTEDTTIWVDLGRFQQR